MTSASAAAWLGFLASPAAPKKALSPLALEGYLTGVVVAPEPIPPSRWVAALWGDEEPAFDSDADLRAVLGTLMTRYNSLIGDIDRSLARLEEDTSAPTAQPSWQTATSLPTRIFGNGSRGSGGRWRSPRRAGGRLPRTSGCSR